VVWFGEALPMEILSEAEKAARSAKLMLVAGTSSLVYPAAALPQIAQSAGAYIVEINPEPTPLTSYANERLAGPAGEILPLLVANAGIPTEIK
jgi:NAD-dependent deacetylase